MKFKKNKKLKEQFEEEKKNILKIREFSRQEKKKMF